MVSCQYIHLSHQVTRLSGQDCVLETCDSSIHPTPKFLERSYFLKRVQKLGGNQLT